MNSTTSNPLVSCIIVNWNGKDIIIDCIDRLLSSHHKEIEIVVVDNASTDGSAELISSFSTKIKLIRNKSNDGFAKGCNIGISNASGKYIALINNDITVTPGWLDDVIPLLETYEEIGIISCRQMNYYHPDEIDSLFHRIHRSLTFVEYGHKELYADEPIADVISSNGGSAIFRKRIFLQLGGLDENYFAYYEDCDFFFRAFLYGWRCVFVPSAVVYHRRSYSFNKVNKFAYYHAGQNRYRFILKNYPFFYIFIKLPVLIVEELILLVSLHNKPQLIGTYFASRFSALRYFISFKWIHSGQQFWKNYQRYKNLKDRLFIPFGIKYPSS